MHIKLFVMTILLVSCASSSYVREIEKDRERLQSSLNECREIQNQNLQLNELYERKKNDLKFCERRLRLCNQRLQNSGY